MVDVGVVRSFFSTVWGNPAAFFSEPSKLFYLWALAGVIILYLIRPRPKKKVFPSLMFLMGEKGKKARNSFFQYLLRNLILLLQLLAVLLFVLALAEPFLEDEQLVRSEETVIVMDVSASMQTWISTLDTRFTQAKVLAKQHVSDTTTIILAGRTPAIHLREANTQTARLSIDKLEAKDVTTNLKDAMILAGEIVQGSGAKIVVVSDFIETDPDTDLSVVRSTLEARDFAVHFAQVPVKGENVGIVDVSVEEESTKVFVKNFQEKEKKVTLTIGDQKKELTLGPKNTDVVGFTTPSGTFKVKLTPTDSFPLDNEAVLTLPEQNGISVLLITNKEGKPSNLELALKSIPNVKLTKAVPPIVPKMEHDVIAFQEVKKESFLKGKITEIKEAVEDGSVLIVSLQENLFSFDFQGMLPVEYKGKGTKDAPVVSNEDHPFMEDVNLGKISSWMQFSLLHNITPLARSGDFPIITFEPMGDGAVLFFGLFDTKNDFMLTADYPIFWGNVFEEIKNHKLAPYVNVNTGHLVNFKDEKKVKTPRGDVETSSLRIEHQGVYSWDDIRMAANLLDLRESDISLKTDLVVDEAVEGEGDDTTKKEKRHITHWFAALAAFVLLLELLVLKYRGEL